MLIEDDIKADFAFTDQLVKRMEDAFHGEHYRQFSVKDDSYVLCFGWRLRAVGQAGRKVALRPMDQEMCGGPAVPMTMRKMYFREFGELREAPVYDGAGIRCGQFVEGPAVIEEPTTTITVLPGYRLEVTKLGNYYVDIRAKD